MLWAELGRVDECRPGVGVYANVDPPGVTNGNLATWRALMTTACEP
jgi:hypothetical protein